MLLKCCTQYASKFGKLSNDHSTGKGQFSFQSQQRRRVPKNVQTTIQLHSFHMLVKLYLKSFKLGFSSIWTKNFQMYKLGLEKAEETEIKSQHLLDHRESKRIPENIYFCFIDYTKAFDCVDHNKMENSLRDGNTQTTYLSPEKPVYRTRSNSYNWTWNNGLVQSWERNMSRLYTATLFI